jgi:hypothetical protein
MQLPLRGCLVTAQGRVVSAWEVNTPGTAATLPVLIREDADGNRTTGQAPDDVIIDLEALTAPGDMSVFYREQHALRAYKDAQGRWHFVRVENGAELPSDFNALLERARAREEP